MRRAGEDGASGGAQVVLHLFIGHKILRLSVRFVRSARGLGVGLDVLVDSVLRLITECHHKFARAYGTACRDYGVDGLDVGRAHQLVLTPLAQTAHTLGRIRVSFCPLRTDPRSKIYFQRLHLWPARQLYSVDAGVNQIELSVSKEEEKKRMSQQTGTCLHNGKTYAGRIGRGPSIASNKAEGRLPRGATSLPRALIQELQASDKLFWRGGTRRLAYCVQNW